MNVWKNRVQKAIHQLKSKLSQITSADFDENNQIAIVVDTELHKLIYNMAKREQISEQTLILQAVQQYIEAHSTLMNSKISYLQKENNPLFHLNGLTKTLKERNEDRK